MKIDPQQREAVLMKVITLINQREQIPANALRFDPINVLRIAYERDDAAFLRELRCHSDKEYEAVEKAFQNSPTNCLVDELEREIIDRAGVFSLRNAIRLHNFLSDYIEYILELAFRIAKDCPNEANKPSVCNVKKVHTPPTDGKYSAGQLRHGARRRFRGSRFGR